MITSFAFGLVNNALIFNSQFKSIFFCLRGVILKPRISSQQFYLAGIADTDVFSTFSLIQQASGVGSLSQCTLHALCNWFSELSGLFRVYHVTIYIPGSVQVSGHYYS